MDAFWKWLLRANARAVLIGAVVALAMVLGWWAWREFFPPAYPSLAGAAGGKEEPLRGMDFSRYLIARDSTTAPESLFVLREGESRHVPKIWQKDPDGPVRQPPNRVTPVVVEPPPDATAKPTHEDVTVVYQGLLTRTDGKSLALLKDSKTGRTMFYPDGKVVRGLKIGPIENTTVLITQADGSTNLLHIREPQTFRLPVE